MTPIDTYNLFLVSQQDERVRMARQPTPVLSKAEALNLAAWLVAVADWSEGHADFIALLKEVEGS